MFRSRQPKIVIIGAASSSFSDILQEMITFPGLDGAELGLVDIDAEGLEIMTKLGAGNGGRRRPWSARPTGRRCWRERTSC